MTIAVQDDDRCGLNCGEIAAAVPIEVAGSERSELVLEQKACASICGRGCGDCDSNPVSVRTCYVRKAVVVEVSSIPEAVPEIAA